VEDRQSCLSGQAPSLALSCTRTASTAVLDRQECLSSIEAGVAMDRAARSPGSRGGYDVSEESRMKRGSIFLLLSLVMVTVLAQPLAA